MELNVFNYQNVLHMINFHVIKELMAYVFIVILLMVVLLLNFVDLKNVKTYSLHKIIKHVKILYQINNVSLMVLFVFLKQNAKLIQHLLLVKEVA